MSSPLRKLDHRAALRKLDHRDPYASAAAAHRAFGVLTAAGS
jgi:hypothetical protein